jgi:hypothetical protein
MALVREADCERHLRDGEPPRGEQPPGLADALSDDVPVGTDAHGGSERPGEVVRAQADHARELPQAQVTAEVARMYLSTRRSWCRDSPPLGSALAGAVEYRPATCAASASESDSL